MIKRCTHIKGLNFVNCKCSKAQHLEIAGRLIATERIMLEMIETSWMFPPVEFIILI